MADTLAPTGLLDRDPADELEATEWIHARIETGRRAALEIALLLAHVRDCYYQEEPGAWLQWAQKEFGYQRRFCFLCLAAGRLLTSVQHAALTECDTDKLAMLAQIPEDQLIALLERWDPSKATREQVRAKVRLWIGDGKDEPDPDPEPEPDKAPRGPNWESYLEKFAGLSDEDAKALADAIGPGIAMRAALHILDVALYHVQVFGDWTAENFEQWRPSLDEVRTLFDDLARQATEPTAKP